MNRTQLKVLWVGIGIFVLMGLFPPCLLGDSGVSAHPRVGFRFILNRAVSNEERPKLSRAGAFSSLTTKIDITQLLVQWAIVAIVTGGLVVTLKGKKAVMETQNDN